jgi:SAM-dependent methyltransferase
VRLTGAAAPPPLLRRARELARVEGSGKLAKHALRVLTQFAVASAHRFGPARTFTFGGATYRYLTHHYNRSWLNERTVEVPIAQAALEHKPGARVLEVGNVLGHYGTVEHLVVDRYEHGPGVLNRDILDFDDPRGFDLIVSISTVEHVGLDRVPPAPELAVEALAHMQGLLAPGGEMLVTVPAGYNEELDAAILASCVGPRQVRALRRAAWRNAWHEVDPQALLNADYDFLACAARAIFVCGGECE